MRIMLLTPGTGGFYCGSCIRDNALASALRGLGHEVTLAPLYLPMALDEPSAADGQPVRFGGVNAYLQQKSGLFRHAPAWVDRLFNAPWMLRLAAKFSGMTKASDLGEMSHSMLLGEQGKQRKEIDKLAAWIQEQGRPDLVCLSNALLLGMVRTLKTKLDGVPVASTLHGEDSFLDTLPSPWKERCWEELGKRAQEADGFIAVSRFYGDTMARRMGVPGERVHVVHNGIALEGYPAWRGEEAEAQVKPPHPPVLGYLARLCHGKGLTTLVDAYLEIRRRGRVPDLRLAAMGTMTSVDETYVAGLRKKLFDAGLATDAAIEANVSRARKLEILGSLTALSTPATYGEAFGLYVLEAMAAGVPVVQPKSGAFPEIIEATGGGVIVPPDDVPALAEGIESVVLDETRWRSLRMAGRKAVLERFRDRDMALGVAQAFEAIRATPSMRARAQGMP